MTILPVNRWQCYRVLSWYSCLKFFGITHNIFKHSCGVGNLFQEVSFVAVLGLRKVNRLVTSGSAALFLSFPFTAKHFHFAIEWVSGCAFHALTESQSLVAIIVPWFELLPGWVDWKRKSKVIGDSFEILHFFATRFVSTGRHIWTPEMKSPFDYCFHLLLIIGSINLR